MQLASMSLLVLALYSSCNMRDKGIFPKSFHGLCNSLLFAMYCIEPKSKINECNHRGSQKLSQEKPRKLLEFKIVVTNGTYN